MTMLVGVDPGVNGGLALVTMTEVRAEPMPAELRGFEEWLMDVLAEANQADSDLHVYIERAQAFPGQGVSSAFNYGQHFGELLGMLSALKIPHTLVRPSEWTRVMHVGAKGHRKKPVTRADAKAQAKAKSLEVCRRLFPKVNLLRSPRCTKAHDGMVDALLIAEYGRRDLAKAPA